MTGPTDVSRIHRDAVIGLIEAAVEDLHVDGRYEVFDGEVTTPEDEIAYPYLVVWPSPADRPTITINGYGGRAQSTIQITAAGTSTDEVLSALDKAGEALHRRVPTVAGRKVAITQQPSGAPPPQPQRDDQVKTPGGLKVYFSFIIVTVYSVPST